MRLHAKGRKRKLRVPSFGTAVLSTLLILICFRILFIKMCGCDTHGRVHVAFTVDDSRFQRRALAVASNSICLHTQRPSRISVHIFTTAATALHVSTLLECYLPERCRKSFLLHTLPDELTNSSFHVRSDADQRLASPFNFVRFKLHRLLPDIGKVLYLDTDVIILNDLTNLYHRHLCRSSNKFLAVARRKTSLRRMLNFEHKIVAATGLNPTDKSFNAGVILIHLENWRKHNVDRELERWVKLNSVTDLYKHGSQPPLLLTFRGVDTYELFDGKWNVEGLGWKILQLEELRHANILHWTGPQKPWLRSGMYKELWESYDVTKCWTS